MIFSVIQSCIKTTVDEAMKEMEEMKRISLQNAVLKSDN